MPRGRRPRSPLHLLSRRSLALLVAGMLLLSLGAGSLWAWRTFASSQGFADAVTDMLKEPAVRATIADQIVNALESQATTAQAAAVARPLLEEVVAEMVATDAFQGIFHAGVRELHSAIVEGRRSRLLVPVDDAAVLVREGLEVVNPGMADAIPDAALTVVVGVSQSAAVDQLLPVASLAGWLAGPLGAAGLACVVLAIRSAADRRRAVEAAGVSLLAIGAGTFALLAALLNVVASFGDDARQRTALRAVFWSTVHLLNLQAKIALVAGTVFVLAAAYAGTGRIGERARAHLNEVRAWVARPVGKLVASLGAIGAGIFAMLWPAATASIVVRVGAFVLFVAGAIGLLDLLGAWRWGVESVDRVHEAMRRLVTASVAGIAAVSATLFFGGFAFLDAVQAPAAGTAGMDETGCNGHVELCDRRLDEVVLAGTHNSMAANREQGWTSGCQTGGLLAQLAAGVRAFLVDLHYGAESFNVVRTDFLDDAEQRLLDADMTADERASVLRALAMLAGAPRPEERDVYLCHNYCELGATRAEEAFRSMHDFLRENPNEVVVLVLEDHVLAEDAMGVLRRSGLAGHAWAWDPATPLPTLRQMIGAHRNLLIMAEQRGGAAPWYPPAYEGLLEETPFRFTSAEEMSCEANRGGTDGPLFLLNHWLSTGTPDPEAAAAVNDVDVLLARARRCRAARGQIPNILAVDFYSQGDLFDVVHLLNGVSDDGRPFTALPETQVQGR